MSILLYVLDRIKGFYLNCSGFQVLSRWVHPVGSCIRFLYVHDRFEGSFCCWLLCPCLACHMALNSRLSSSGLICCYALSSSFVGYSPLVVHPWLFALGSVNFSTVYSPPVSSGSAEFLRVLCYYMAQSLRGVVTLLGSRLFQSSIETKACSEPYSFWVVSCLRDGVTLLGSRQF